MYAGKPAGSRAEPRAVRRSGTSAEPVLQELLGLARAHTGADIAFVGRVEGAENVVVAGTPSLPIGGYLGVPVQLPEGRLYGTLSCVSKVPRSSFDTAAVAFLTAVAASLSRLLASEEPARVGRRQLLADIDDVLASDGVRMAYQPIVDLATGDLRGVEALARFARAGRSTEQWFTDAATVDRGSELELETARTALAESADWPGELWLNLSASVLVSPAAEALLEGRDLSRVVLEISEREEVANYTALRHCLEHWRARGLRLAVDDAGAGFSSLRHVLELAPDVIKLDISLVRGLPADPARRALVTALVAFASESGAVVLGEGVQDEQELAVLRAAGVTMGQGFYIGKPVPAGAHEKLMRTGLTSNRQLLLGK